VRLEAPVAVNINDVEEKSLLNASFIKCILKGLSRIPRLREFGFYENFNEEISMRSRRNFAIAFNEFLARNHSNM